MIKVEEAMVQVIRSERRTVALEITPDLHVLVRAPRFMREADIRRFVDEKRDWLTSHLATVRARQAEKEKNPPKPTYTEAELARLTKEAKRVLPARVAVLASLVGVSYGKITVRRQKTRWGSCSAAGNLNFNCLLMLCPPEIIDYVIVHELCHRKEMNHSSRFWGEVERALPDYQSRRDWLKQNGGQLTERLPK